MFNDAETFTLFPELVCVEILKVSVDGVLGYASQLVLILDSEKKKILYLPTDIFEETSLETLQRTTIHAINLFGALGNLAVVVDTKTGEIIERFDLNSVFTKGPGEPEEKILLH